MSTDTDASKPLSQLNEYRLLGASGLRVSPLCLGAMTFGTEWGWGADFKESKKIFDYFVAKGGNFIDTANIYTGGTSERFVGELVAPIRSQMVVATKFSINVPPSSGIPMPPSASNPNHGGNHRKALVQSVHDSLERLKLDYTDILYVHAWDFRTPVEETMRALDDVVRSGRVLYVAVSDTPAWVVAKSNTVAAVRGWSPYIGLQTRYNLLDRSVEWDLAPMAKGLDIGIIPWGSTAEGFLTGKHTREKAAAESKRGIRIERHFAHERNWRILDEVVAVAKEIGRTPAQVSLNWLAQRPGVTSPLVGARTFDQLKENLASLDFALTPDQVARLDTVSSKPLGALPFPQNLGVDVTEGITNTPKRF